MSSAYPPPRPLFSSSFCIHGFWNAAALFGRWENVFRKCAERRDGGLRPTLNTLTPLQRAWQLGRRCDAGNAYRLLLIVETMVGARETSIVVTGRSGAVAAPSWCR